MLFYNTHHNPILSISNPSNSHMTLVNKLHNYWKVLFYFIIIYYFEAIISLLSYDKNSLKQSKVVYIQTCVLTNSHYLYKNSMQLQKGLIYFIIHIILCSDYGPAKQLSFGEVMISLYSSDTDWLMVNIPLTSLRWCTYKLRFLRTPMTLVKKN